MATQTLKEFIIKGFVLNDEMLKNGKPFGKDYFDELLERSLDILPNTGSITHEKAVEKAHSEYEQFRIEQDKKYISDLDLEISKLKK